MPPLAAVEPVAWRIALAAVVLASIWRGGRVERWGAGLLVAANVLSLIVQDRSPWTRIDSGLAIVDAGLFVALAALAVAGRRTWTIFAAGFQGSATCMHVARLVAPSVLPTSYWVASLIWSDLVLASLALGVWLYAGSTQTWWRRSGVRAKA